MSLPGKHFNNGIYLRISLNYVLQRLCRSFLQCWSYYHLNVGRPKLHHDPIHECFPFVLRWKGKQSGPTSNRDVVFYRKALDSLKATDVSLDMLGYDLSVFCVVHSGL